MPCSGWEQYRCLPYQLMGAMYPPCRRGIAVRAREPVPSRALDFHTRSNEPAPCTGPGKLRNRPANPFNPGAFFPELVLRFAMRRN